MPKIIKINIKKIDQVPDISSKICSYESLENLRMDISKYAIKGNRAIELNCPITLYCIFTNIHPEVFKTFV